MRLPAFNPKAALVIGVIGISTSAVLVRLAEDAPAAIIAFYRLFFAVLIMAPFVVAKYRDELRKITKRNWIISIFSGIFLAMHFILWFESLNYTSVASSVVFVSTQPLFAFIGTYLLFRERFSYGAIISMVITIFGSFIIGWGDFQIGGSALFGDMLAILGAIAITGYFLIGQSVRKSLTLMSYTFIVYGVASITLLIYNLFLQNSFIGYSSTQWWIFLSLAIIPTFFGHSLFNWSLKWLSTSTVTMAGLFEPIGAAILAYFFLNEMITWSQFLGGTIVIFGLYLFTVSTSKKRSVTISQKTNNR
ncbi:DMT family transporter [Oceanobacillus sp. CAU 1775]